MEQTYVVLEQRIRQSRYGQHIIEIDLVGCQDRQQYKTYLDPSFRNWANWKEITAWPSCGYLLNNLTLRQPGIINADSRPRILWRTENPDQIFDELLDVWREQDSQDG